MAGKYNRVQLLKGVRVGHAHAFTLLELCLYFRRAGGTQFCRDALYAADGTLDRYQIGTLPARAACAALSRLTNSYKR